jgi:hypothetical protein
MITSISGRDRRTLIVGCATLVLLIGASRGAPALRDALARRVAIQAALRRRLAAARAAGRMMPALRDSLVARRTRLAALNAHVITASTPAAASAMLGALVERIADDANIKVSSLDLRSDSVAKSSTTRLSLRMTAEGDAAGLGTFLTAVEQRPEAMVVRQLSISQGDATASDDRVEVLRFDVTIDGLALVSADRTTPVTVMAAAPAARPPAEPRGSAFIDRDPFRLANRPARARYTPATSALAVAEPNPAREPHDPRPTMTLRAIAGGPPWEALIDGLPGRARAELVRAGTVIDRLTIRAITRDSVVVRGPDTTWVLSFAKPR